MTSGPQFGIMGDEDYGTELPQTEVPETDLAVERNAAKFSRTKEFKALKDHFETRIAYYQTFLPDGRAINQEIPTGAEWQVANIVIAEFKAVIQAYEDAYAAITAKK